jgi:hypothetical protein
MPLPYFDRPAAILLKEIQAWTRRANELDPR